MNFETTYTYNIAPQDSTQSFKSIAKQLAKVYSEKEFSRGISDQYTATLKILYSLEGNFDYAIFIKHLKESYSQNTVVCYSVALKSLFKMANLTINTKGVKVKNNIPEAYHLNEQELDKIRKHNYFCAKQQKCADIMILMAYTGCRFSDYPKIEYKEGNVCSIRQQKTGTTVYLPIHDYAKKILKKYGNKVPLMGLGTFNMHIRLACQSAGIGEKSFKISSHSGRRSFSTNLYERKVDPISIMAVTGHKNVSDFLRYVRSSQKQHAIMINDVWKK